MTLGKPNHKTPSMKAIAVCFYLFLWFAIPAQALTLLTPSFVVVIIDKAPEGTVSSDDVLYVGVSRKNGNTIQVKGRTIHTLAADGVTPSKFLGWSFTTDKATYFVSEGGLLEVKSGKKILVSEKGEWVD